MKILTIRFCAFFHTFKPFVEISEIGILKTCDFYALMTILGQETGWPRILFFNMQKLKKNVQC